MPERTHRNSELYKQRQVKGHLIFKFSKLVTLNPILVRLLH